jgi:hypothetical protein
VRVVAWSSGWFRWFEVVGGDGGCWLGVSSFDGAQDDEVVGFGRGVTT